MLLSAAPTAQPTTVDTSPINNIEITNNAVGLSTTDGSLLKTSFDEAFKVCGADRSRVLVNSITKEQFNSGKLDSAKSVYYSCNVELPNKINIFSDTGIVPTEDSLFLQFTYADGKGGWALILKINPQNP